jgi:prepilin-type N-terminal cleavage/methylation domain-containing protein
LLLADCIPRPIDPPTIRFEQATMKLHDQRGFSILELIAAAVILGVVCTAAIATVAPIRAKSRDHVSERELATLNAAAHQFFLQHGRHPDNLRALLRDNSQSNLPQASAPQANSPLADPIQLRRIEQSYAYSPATGQFTRK